MYVDPYNALRTMDVVPQSHICRIKHMLHCRFLSMTQQSQKKYEYSKKPEKNCLRINFFYFVAAAALTSGFTKKELRVIDLRYLLISRYYEPLDSHDNDALPWMMRFPDKKAHRRPFYWYALLLLSTKVHDMLCNKITERKSTIKKSYQNDHHANLEAHSSVK